MKVFQIVLLVVFGFSILIAILIFSGVLPGFGTPEGGVGGSVEVWGTVPAPNMQELLAEFNQTHEKEFSITYVYKPKASFRTELVEAIARAQGPDLVFLTDDMILNSKDLIYSIPPANYGERRFVDNFIPGAQIFVQPDGSIIALPITVDPLVMYYNRDFFINAGVTKAPSTWAEFILQLPNLNQIDNRRNIIQTGLAMGEFFNMNNAKETLAAIFMQAGNNIIDYGRFGIESKLADRPNTYAVPPAEASVNFFTQFADATQTTYSWNRSMPNDKEAFVAGMLGTYFGLASELNDIRRRNPNMDLDAVLIPQREATGRKITKGEVEGLAVLRSSRNMQTAFLVLYTIAEGSFAGQYANLKSLPPARIDLLNQGISTSGNRYTTTFYNSALISRSWLDPNPQQTEQIFSDMAMSVVTKRQTVSESLSQAHLKLNAILNR